MQAFVDTPMWNRPLAEQELAGLPRRSSTAPPTCRPTPRRPAPPTSPGCHRPTSRRPRTIPLRDEGITYALRLLQAGVSVELHQFPGTFHGSALVVTAEVSRRAQEESTRVLRHVLGTAAKM